MFPKESYYFESGASASILSRSLRNYGVAVVKNFVAHEDLQNLNNEFLSILKSSKNLLLYDGCNVVTLEVVQEKFFLDGADRVEAPAIKKVFGHPLIKELSADFYGNFAHRFEAVYIHHDKKNIDYVRQWHFDHYTPSLKFFVYLTDTTQENGAFEYGIGSHREGYFRQMCSLYRGDPMDEMPNQIPEEEVLMPAIMEGDAGSVVIFNSNGFHRSGELGEDKERRVVRAFTNCTRSFWDKIVDKCFFYPINIGKFLMPSGGKISHNHISHSFSKK